MDDCRVDVDAATGIYNGVIHVEHSEVKAKGSSISVNCQGLTLNGASINQPIGAYFDSVYYCIRNAQGRTVFGEYVVIGPNYYNLWICNQQVSNNNASNIIGEEITGSVSYNASNNTLTLNNATLNPSSYQAIDSDIPDLTIVLEGNNTIATPGYGIYARQNMVLGGTGILDITGLAAIKVEQNQNLTIQDGCLVKAHSTGSNPCVSGNHGTFSIVHSRVSAEATDNNAAIAGFDHLSIEGSIILHPEGAVYDETDRRLEENGNVVSDVNITAIPQVNDVFDIENLRYTIIEQNENHHYVSIAADPNVEGPMGSIIIPATVTIAGQTYNVTEIAENGFKNNTQISSVSFEPNTYFTTFGNYCFAHSTVKHVFNVPSSTLSIGHYSFTDCPALEIFTFQNPQSLQLQSIGASAFTDDIHLDRFGYNNRKIVYIPSTVTSLGDYAFSGCRSIYEVSYLAVSCEDDNTSCYVFNGCTSIYKVNIGPEVTFIPSHLFANNTAIEQVEVLCTSACTAGSASYPAFRGCSNLISISMEKGATSVPSYIMSGVTSLSTINYNSPVTTIGDYAFNGCTGLTSFELPATLTTLGTTPFQGVSVDYIISRIPIPSNVINEAALGFTGTRTGGKYGISVPSGHLSDYSPANWPNAEMFQYQSHIGESFDDDYFTYTVLSEMVNGSGLVVSGDVSVKAKSGVSLPSIIDIHQSYRHYTNPEKTQYVDYWVTSIEERGFSYNLDITAVHFVGSSHFTSIGKKAFYYCTNLTQVTNVPVSLEVIGTEAFGFCNNLVNFEFSDTPSIPALTTIGEGAFKSTILENFYKPSSQPRIYIPQHVTSIGSSAFVGTHATMLEYGALNCDTVGGYFPAFSYYLTSIFIDAEVQSIPPKAFSNLIELEQVSLVAHNCISADSAFYACGNAEQGFVLWINPNVTRIPDGFMRDAQYLSSIIFTDDNTTPSQCTSIGVSAFENSGIQSINVDDSWEVIENLPASLQTIEKRAFMGCANLETIAYSSKCHLKTIADEAFKNSNIRAINIDTADFTINSLIFPRSLTSIGDNAFEGCDEFELIQLPYSMTLGVNAFKNCTGLQSLYLNTAKLHYPNFEVDGNVDFTRNPFYGCPNLTKVYLQDQVTAIPDYFMADIISLSMVTLFGSYRPYTIGNYAFYHTGIHSYDMTYTTSIGDWAFAYCPLLYTIQYRNTSHLAHIGSHSFLNCRLTTYKKYGSNEEGVCLPEGLETIGENAFAAISATSISIPTTVSRIGDIAFQNCSNLTSVYFNAEDAVMSWYCNVFRYCENLSTFTFGPAVQKCTGRMFGDPKYNETPPITTIYFNAFDCTMLYSKPGTIESIFSGLLEFTTLHIGQGVTRIPSEAFRDCAHLTTVTFPSSLTYIGARAFKDCTSLISAQAPSMMPSDLTLPNCLTYLGEKAFKGALFGTVYIPASCVTMDMNPLDGVMPYSMNIQIANSVVTYRGSSSHVLTEADLFGSTEFGSNMYSMTVRGDVAHSNYNATNYPHAEIYVDEPWENWENVITDINEASSDGMSNAIISTNQTLTADRTVNGLVIKEGVTITVPSDMTLRFGNSEWVYNFAGYTGIVVEDGGQLFADFPTEATMEKNIQAYTPGKSDNWYFLSMPFIQNDGINPYSGLAPTSVLNMIDGMVGTGTNNYDLYSYSEPDSMWVNYEKQPASFVLDDAHGYLYANAQNTTLQFQGKFDSWSNPEVDLTFTPPVAEENPDLRMYNPESILAGFNLIGNPYSHSIFSDAFDREHRWQGSVYTLNGARDEIVLLGDDDYYIYEFKPMEGFFVKRNSEYENMSITFEYDNTPREGREEPTITRGLTIHLEQNGKELDHAYLRLEEKERIEKIDFFGGSPRIFFMEDNGRYAAVSFHEDLDGKPLYFTPTRDGEFTLSFNTRGEKYSYLHLIDRKNGTDIDLLGDANGSYTFESSITDSANRFVVIIRK